MARPKKEEGAVVEELNPNDLITCEMWKVNVEFKYRINEETGQSDRYVSDITKAGTAPIRTTVIERRHQTELNSHTQSSNLHYYEI